MPDEGVWTAEELAAAKAKANETLRRWRKNDLRIEIVESLDSMTGNRDAAVGMADHIMLLIEDSERKLQEARAEQVAHQEIDLVAAQAVLDLASSTEHSVDCVLNALHLPQIMRERNQFREECEQLRRELEIVNRMAQRAHQDLFDEEQEHEELVGVVNDVILRMSRTAAPQELTQMLRDGVNATSTEDVSRHKQGARLFVETVAEALGVLIPAHMTPSEVIAEARRLHSVVMDFTGVLDELDSIVADWRGDHASTTKVIERLSRLVADGGEGSALVSELEAWQGSYFRLRSEVLRIADAIEPAAGGLAHELRVTCAEDEPLRRSYAHQHRDDVDLDSGEAIDPWRPHSA